MAESLLSFGVEKLWDLLVRETDRLKGVDEQLTELKSDLDLLRLFLKDADAKRHANPSVRNWVEEIKEVVFDAEDIIETFLLKEELSKTSGIKKRMRRLSCIIVDRRKLALDIRGISDRISKVIGKMKTILVQQMIFKGGEDPHLLQERQREMRKTYPTSNENDVVGLEKNVMKLVGYLAEEDKIQVVSITGMGGIGKTTLARQVFNHEMVKNHFDGVAWVCISQQFTTKYVWQTILQKLSPRHDEHLVSNMSEDQLQAKLFSLLETNKSLIVLDDMWKEEDWDRIKLAFPLKKGYWKVLLTSRNERVGLRVDPTCVTFKPECLTIENSWTLFQRIALPINDASESKVYEEMEEMGKQMIKHCGGLPLAVRVLGGLLAAKYTLDDWKRVSENIGSQLVEKTSSSNGSIDQVLSMSFEELPSYLKHCFLSLAHFPEDHKINIEDLSYYWAAEGVFKPRHYDGETIRDIGDSYIEELVQRNMVISGRDVTTLRYETCHLHDMMRDVCLFKAKEDNFLQIASTNPSTSNFQSHGTSRRFVSHDPSTLDVERDLINPKLRSLVVVLVKNLLKKRCKLSGSSFKRLELLRVLDLFRAEFEGGKLPSGIGKLIHLRYLSLKWANVSHIPASLGNLLLLIYLNLDIAYEDILVPNALMGMKELRYLALPEDMHKKTKLELSNLVKLETLKNFSTKNSSVKDLRGMVRLRTLTMEVTGKTSMETVSASIGGLRHLEHLDIRDDRSKRNVEEGIVLDFSHLKCLTLFMYMPNLLKEQHFPSHLTTLTLRKCGLEEDPMPILEKLLQLKEVTLGYESFSGRRMVCSGGGFPQLQKLQFLGLEEWEEWIVEEGSMPLLHTLSIRLCEKLKELPDGLRFITSLKELYIIGAPLEFKEKLSREGEDFYKVEHIPLFIIFIKTGNIKVMKFARRESGGEGGPSA
ncbi:putative disease resistance protein [Cardamine amara subsp. amara]|uniref:Disease resistance protein n=1 Tax=Cardamine amara subsp. amara TaxID=228776 RepID=A0ABD0ZIR6_CARAN